MQGLSLGFASFASSFLCGLCVFLFCLNAKTCSEPGATATRFFPIREFVAIPLEIPNPKSKLQNPRNTLPTGRVSAYVNHRLRGEIFPLSLADCPKAANPVSSILCHHTCGRGGTGRRAGLRSLLPQGSGSSILLVRTKLHLRK